VVEFLPNTLDLIPRTTRKKETKPTKQNKDDFLVLMKKASTVTAVTSHGQK
jgi:hypothetical protein